MSKNQNMEIKNDLFPPSLFLVYLLVLLLMSGLHTGIIVGMNVLDWSDIVQTLQDTLNGLKGNAKALAEGSTQLSAGVTALTDGISKLYSGSVELKKGTGALVSAGPSISKGLSALRDGAKALKDGMKTFDEEGIQELSDLAGDDLTDVIDRVKALKDADVAYDNYSGLAKGSTGEVRFVIETDAIEK